MTPRKKSGGQEASLVTVRAAKGRPMLSWIGKRPLSGVSYFPAQHIESFGFPESPADGDGAWETWPANISRGGLLYHGDNKDILAYLIASGFRSKIDFIYIDPPFDSGANYVRKVRLRGPSGTARVLGEAYSLGEQIQYTDIWANDNYLQFMYERLLLLRELLAENSNIVLHTDHHKTHFLRCLMDEVFGPERFKNELVWHYPDNFQGNVKGFASNHDILLWYGFGDYPWTKPSQELEQVTTRPTRVWDAATHSLQILRDKEGRPIYKEYTEASFDDVLRFPQRSVVVPDAQDYTGYPTAKPPALIALLVDSLSPPGGLVLDSFIGSGTTAVVAQRLGRRWIGCDINRGAIQTTAKRLEEVMSGANLTEVEGKVMPAQNSFTIWRVNDYDLEVPHSEVVALVTEQLGIERLPGDRFFDGVLGRALVKIAPFQHPLSPVDLDQVGEELAARPDEDRPVTVVCLGIEIAAERWLEDWNRLRRAKGTANRIAVIELRTDESYGGFIRHEPAKLKLKCKRQKGLALVEIENFISPTIVSRLARESGILQAGIEDWRVMVDSITIDPDFDGAVFNIRLADVPKRSSDLVVGKYELKVGAGPHKVAVKVVDMLGEEVVETCTI